MASTNNPKNSKAAFVDGAKVARAKKNMVTEQIFIDLSETFKAIGDTTRTKMLLVLAHEELCVGDLATLLDMNHSAISHQLRHLRAMKLVRNRREGRITYYALDDDHIRRLLHEGLKHVMGKEDDD